MLSFGEEIVCLFKKYHLKTSIVNINSLPQLTMNPQVNKDGSGALN